MKCLIPAYVQALRRSQHAKGSDLTAEEHETLEVHDLLPPEEGE